MDAENRHFGLFWARPSPGKGGVCGIGPGPSSPRMNKDLACGVCGWTTTMTSPKSYRGSLGGPAACMARACLWANPLRNGAIASRGSLESGNRACPCPLPSFDRTEEAVPGQKVLVTTTRGGSSKKKPQLGRPFLAYYTSQLLEREQKCSASANNSQRVIHFLARRQVRALTRRKLHYFVLFFPFGRQNEARTLLAERVPSKLERLFQDSDPCS